MHIYMYMSGCAHVSACAYYGIVAGWDGQLGDGECTSGDPLKIMIA